MASFQEKQQQLSIFRQDEVNDVIEEEIDQMSEIKSIAPIQEQKQKRPNIKFGNIKSIKESESLQNNSKYIFPVFHHYEGEELYFLAGIQVYKEKINKKNLMKYGRFIVRVMDATGWSTKEINKLKSTKPESQYHKTITFWVRNDKELNDTDDFIKLSEERFRSEFKI